MTQMFQSKFADTLNKYVPYTFSQFEESITGKCEDEVDKRGQRSYCIKWCALHTLLIPFDMTGRLIVNGVNTVYKILQLSALTLVLPFQPQPKSLKWRKLAGQTFDTALATLFSPFQPFAKISRLALGILLPKTFSFPLECVTIQRQLDVSNNKVMAVIEAIPRATYSTPEKLADARILFALYNYATRWGLIKAKPQAFNSNRQKDRIADLNHDPLEIKCQLFQAFHELVNKWRREGIALNDLTSFVQKNFKTADQKRIIKEFFMKRATRILHISSFFYDDSYVAFDDKKFITLFTQRLREVKQAFELANQSYRI